MANCAFPLWNAGLLMDKTLSGHKIGFVGLGNMGGRLASCLVSVGDLTVYDAYEPSAEKFRDRARVARSVAEAGTDAVAVGVCVRTGEQVSECAGALLPAMPRF